MHLRLWFSDSCKKVWVLTKPKGRKIASLKSSLEIAKTGSLCCVAARPHGSSTGSRDWNVGRTDPFWQTNSSFSPPLSRRWDLRLGSGGQSFWSSGDGGGAFYGSSLSSNSKESRSWARGEQVHSQRYSPSDGAGSYVSSPADSSQYHHLTPSPVLGISIDEYSREPVSEPLIFSRLPEGPSGVSQSIGSTSSRSDGSDFDHTPKAYASHMSSRRSFSSRYSFLSKPVHPLSFKDCDDPEGEEVHGSAQTARSKSNPHSDSKSIRELTILRSPGLLELGDTSRWGTGQWSSASSIDFTDISEPLEPESCLPPSRTNESSKCGLCERFLSQRSPWGSRRIVRSGDMPIAGVLPCWHVYHAECLERTTPKTQKHDPPCPLCVKSEENVIEQWAVCRLKNGLPRLKPLGEEGGPSRVWTCGQVGDCVEGVLQTPSRNNMLTLGRSRLKRQLSMKGNSAKEGADNSKNGGLCSSQLLDGRILGDQVAAVGSSRKARGSTLRRLNL